MNPKPKTRRDPLQALKNSYQSRFNNAAQVAESFAKDPAFNSTWRGTPYVGLFSLYFMRQALRRLNPDQTYRLLQMEFNEKSCDLLPPRQERLQEIAYIYLRRLVESPDAAGSLADAEIPEYDVE